MLNQVKSVVYGFSLFPQLFSFVFVGKLAFLSAVFRTQRLRGIWHAWHFRFALGSVIKSLCGSFCSACLHPLTRR
ncbi:DUF3265 domain-containing protein [Vibrio vulnificus]|uniref:hypothetical protein n=1 Tax=Vibrio vulnificus TaxID=672 RepID=UPI0039B6EDD8|nr:DUF3265 domain-containing protein [Vibrio vulnificus]